MGVVYTADDLSLDREVAVKALLPGRLTPAAVARFANEARITATLAHPGIPPVHGFGLLPDGSPFLAMKLVRGTTLAARLKGRASPAADPDRLVQVFEQICQAVGFAHDRGVIHRDLKPLNVMVGEFGEVQVMDWGLAKRLRPRRPLAEPDPDPWGTIDWHPTAPPGGADTASGGLTQAGQVMGTLAYMPPEQALGDVDRVDKRADVFALGAILCEILTGHPPYTGDDMHAVWQLARVGDMAAARERLAGCGGEPELVGLVTDCLAARPEDRPGTAGAVAARLDTYRSGVRRRLEHAQAAAVAAEVRTGEERKRRRIAIGFLGSLLLIAIGIGAAGLWYQARQSASRDRHTRLEAELDQTLRTGEGTLDALHGDLADPVEAMRLPADTIRWDGRLEAVRASVQRVEGLQAAAERPVDASLLARVESLTALLQSDELDRELATRLDGLRRPRSVVEDGRLHAVPNIHLFRAEFDKAGLRIETGDPEEPAGRIRASRLRWFWVAALDCLASNTDVTDALRRQALEVSRRADPHPWRDSLRDPAVWTDRARLEAFACDPEAEKQPPAAIEALARQVQVQGGRAAVLLRKALSRHPQNYYLLVRLSAATEDLMEGVACIRAAVALRPKDGALLNTLGAKQRYLGWEDDSLACFRRAIDLDPTYCQAYTNLANLLAKRGQPEEAIAYLRKAVALDPVGVYARWELSRLLQHAGHGAEAIEGFRYVAARRPDDPAIHYHLGAMFLEAGQVGSAAASFRRAVELYPADNPYRPHTQNQLGRCESLLAIEGRLPGLLAGTAQPASTTEALAVADYCSNVREDYVAAARFYGAAFGMSADKPGHHGLHHGVDAATAAARAAAGDGAGKAVGEARGALRRQALTWARGALVALRSAAADTPGWRAYAGRTLRSFEQGPAFRAVRDEESLSSMSLDERAAWRQFWADVALLRVTIEAREKTPFVTVPRGGAAERRHETLARALADAASGDAIEIRGDGPFDQVSLSTKAKALVVRAGPEVAPVLRFRGAAAAAFKPGEHYWQVADGGISLEGLEFDFEGDTPGNGYYAIVSVDRGTVFVAGCRFRYRGGKPHLIAINASDCSSLVVDSCEFSGAFTTAIGVSPAVVGRLHVENCLFTGRSPALVVESIMPTNRSVDVRLTRNTFAGLLAVDWRVRAIHPAGKESAKPATGFSVISRENVFAPETTAVLINYMDTRPEAIPTPERGAEMLRGVCRWREERNLYAAKTPLMRMAYGKIKDPWAWYEREAVTSTVAPDLGAWERFWGVRDTDSRTEWVRFQGGAGQDLLDAHRVRGADAYSLHPDTVKQLGITAGQPAPGIPAGLVGSGTAHERWKRAGGYVKWFLHLWRGS